MAVFSAWPVADGTMHLCGLHVGDRFTQEEANVIGEMVYPDHQWMAGSAVFTPVDETLAPLHLHKAYAYIDGQGTGSGPDATVKVALYQYDGNLWLTSDPVSVSAGQAPGWVEFTFTGHDGDTIPSGSGTYGLYTDTWSTLLMGVAVTGGSFVQVWSYPTAANLVPDALYLSGSSGNYTVSGTGAQFNYSSSNPDFGSPGYQLAATSSGQAATVKTNVMDLDTNFSTYSAAVNCNKHVSTGGTPTLTFAIDWLDGGSSLISSSTTTTPVSFTNYRLDNISKPGGAVKARLSVTIQSSGTCYTFPTWWQFTPGSLLDLGSGFGAASARFVNAQGAYIPIDYTVAATSPAFGGARMNLVSGNPPSTYSTSNLRVATNRPAIYITASVDYMETWETVDHTTRFDFDSLDLSVTTDLNPIMALSEPGFKIQNVRALIYATSAASSNSMVSLYIDISNPDNSIYCGFYDGWNGDQIGTGTADADRTEFKDWADFGYRGAYNAGDRTLSLRAVKPSDPMGAFTGVPAVGDFNLWVGGHGGITASRIAILFDLVPA